MLRNGSLMAECQEPESQWGFDSRQERRPAGESQLPHLWNGGGTHSRDFWEDEHSAWHSVGVTPTELLLRVWTTDAGSLWSWSAHCRVRDLSGTPCRDTEDVSSELRAHPQGNWKRPAFSRAFSHHQCKTLATLQKKSNLTFIRLCLIPSTICSIWRKNWSREAGEAMALKERPAEVRPVNRIQEKGRNRGVSPDNAPGGRQAFARQEGPMGPLWYQAARDFNLWARHEN